MEGSSAAVAVAAAAAAARTGSTAGALEELKQTTLTTMACTPAAVGTASPGSAPGPSKRQLLPLQRDVVGHNKAASQGPARK